MLIGLRESIAAVLAEQGKTAWAAEEFDYLRSGAGQAPPATRRDRWRRTSGIHRVRNQRGLAAVRELWTVRDEIAQRRDIAPGRILPDSAIIDAATADPKTLDDLVALPIFGGRRQRRSAATWLAALKPRAKTLALERKPNRPTVHRRRRAGLDAGRRPRRGSMPPAPRCGSCPSGSRCRRRTWSRPTWSGGCAGTGKPPTTRQRRSTSFWRPVRPDAGSAN